MADGPIRDSNQSPDFVLNLNRHHFVKFGDRSFVGHNQNKLPPTRLAKKIKNNGVCFAIEVVETFVQEEKGTSHNVIYGKDKGQIAPLTLTATELVEVRVNRSLVHNVGVHSVPLLPFKSGADPRQGNLNRFDKQLFRIKRSIKVDIRNSCVRCGNASATPSAPDRAAGDLVKV